MWLKVYLPVSNRKPEISSFCGDVLALTWLFFQTGGSCLTCNSKILCCYILFESLWLAKKTSIRIKELFQMHFFLRMTFSRKCEGIELWEFNRNSLNPWKSATEESYSTCKGTASFKGTTNLRRLTVNWENDQFF